ncbi:hypothetical protein [Stenotrophomonas humi]
MSVDLFELSVDGCVNFELVRNSFSLALGISHNCIVSEEDYWRQDFEREGKVGVTLVEGGGNFNVLLTGVSDLAIYDATLASVAKVLATEGGVRVAIGDYTSGDSSELAGYLIFLQSGEVRKGVEDVKDDGGFYIKYA